ncbi:apolipoprotein N-acyltransferase [Deltaproteobacteria bacterium TL4]
MGTTPLTSTILSGLWAFIGWLVSIWWVAPTLVKFFQFSTLSAWGLLSILCVFSSIPYLIIGYLLGKFQWVDYKWGSVGAAVIFTVVISWFPLILPGTPAHFLYKYPLFIQVLDLGGIPLLLFCLAWFNFKMVQLIRNYYFLRKMPYKEVVLLLVFVGLITGYGKYRIESVNEELKKTENISKIRIAAIQPNLDRKDPLTPLFSLSKQVVQDFADINLIVWPETPISFSFVEDEKDRKKIEVLISQIKKPLVMVSSYVNAKDKLINGEVPYYNTAHYIDKQGNLQNSHYKQILVPFVEYLPYEKNFPSLRKVFKNTYRYTHGTEISIFSLTESIRAIPLICYEVIFSKLTRDYVNQGGNIILNLTNDKWFGNTNASAFHFSLALYRTIEYRIPLVRVTNSGISAFVSATGESSPINETPIFQKATKVFDIALAKHPTLYLEWGDWFLYVITVFFIAGYILKLRLYIVKNVC